MKKTFLLIPSLLLSTAGLAAEGEGTGSSPVVEPPPNQASKPAPRPDWLDARICQVLGCEEAAKESAPEATPDEG